MNVTLKDIAKKLGVSTATISKAINNRPGVREDLRKQIIQAIEEMDIRPKQRVGGFKRNHAVGVNLLVRINPSAQSDPFYSLITDSISKELQHAKTSVNYYVMNENKLSPAQFDNIFKDKPAEGNILVGADFETQLLEKIHQLKMPTVLVDNMYPEFSSVNTDNFKGAAEAVSHLGSLGHRKIVFLSGPLEHKSIMQRLEGYKDGMRNIDGVGAKYFECPGVSVDDGFNRIDQLQKIDFTAIFAANDKLAIGALKALKNKGLRVPEDVSLVGFDDIEWALHTEPPLTTVRIAKHQMGALAAQLFTNLYRNPDMHPVDMKVAASLVVRESTAAAAKQE